MEEEIMFLLKLLIGVLEFGKLFDILSLCESTKISIYVFKKDVL